MPTPTDVLDEDIKELRGQVKEIAAAIVDLKVEMVSRFERIETRLDQRASVVNWVATAIAPAIIALMGFIVAGAWYAGALANRLTQVEAKVEAPKR